MDPSRGRKLGFCLLTAAGVVAVLEVFSTLVFYVAEGRSFSFHAQAERRQQLVGESFGGDGEPESSRPPLGNIAAAREVIHPFLGFVLNPDLNQREDWVAHGHPLIDPRGFSQLPGEEDRAGDLEIGIFGGSMALLLCFQGRERLSTRLGEIPAFAGKSLAFPCQALGGYKQPQQLMTLAYALALGDGFDAVILLDGFNELALSSFDNYRSNVAPHYPRGWKERVETLPDRQAQRLAGRTVFLRDQRAQLAHGFSGSPWRHSITGNLVWRLLDRRLGKALNRAQIEAAGYVPAENSYQWQGPFEPRSDPADVLAETAALWRLSSLQMHRLCTAAGIPFFHFLQPNQYVPGSKPMTRGEKLVAYDDDSPYRWAAENGYPLLVAAGAELRRAGVRFHDLSQVFKGVEEPLYVDNCCHVDEDGNRLLADAVADAMLAGLEPD